MTVGKAVALRRAGSLPALVALEVGAVVGLHRLGGLAAFRVPWQHLGRDLGAWLLYSPVEDVLGAVLRMVALLVAWWLLLSTALYLAASVTRVPALVRSVEWLALPVVRRVADRAVAVALATSIAGASPAVAGTMATSVPEGSPAVAGALVARRTPGPVTATSAAAAATTAAASAAAATTTTTTAPPSDGYVPRPAGPPGAQPSAPSSSTSTSTTTPTTTTRPSTTTPTTTTRPATTAAPSTTAAQPTTTPTVEPPGPKPTFPATTTTAAPTTTRAPATTSTRAAAPTTAPARPPAPTTSAPGPGYVPHPAGTTTTTTSPQGGGGAPPGPPGQGGQGPGPSGTVLPTIHRVVPGDNLWLIARNQLALATERNPRSLRNSEVASYWLRVVAANRSRLRSKHPDLIYPGEYVRLPAIRKRAGS